VKVLAVKGSDQPIHLYRFGGFLQTRDSRAADSGFTTLQLHQAQIQYVGVPASEAKGNHVGDAGAIERN
jgi:hypothetical protein